MSNIDNADVVILCGGLGKRLRPKIGEAQKVMAEVNQRPFLDLMLDRIQEQGFRRVILCTGFQAQEVENYYQKNPRPLTFVFSREKEPLGTGGAVQYARPLIKSNPFLVLNGDCFCPIDFHAFLRFHRAKKALASVAVSMMEDKKDFGSVLLNPSHKVVNFLEKNQESKASHVNTGIYLFQQDVFDHMPRETKFSLEYDVFPGLTHQAFWAFVVPAKFFDIGTPERYAHVQQIVGRKKGSIL